jgi:hypothetical protein
VVPETDTTVISMVKRRLEAFVRGRTAWSQRRELRLKVLTHNVMILLRIEIFYIAIPIPLELAYLPKGHLEEFENSSVQNSAGCHGRLTPKCQERARRRRCGSLYFDFVTIVRHF